MSLPDPLAHRTADHPIEPLFLRRWSPRAMSGEPVRAEELDRLFEAARWAPSTFNEQEWRFRHAARGSAHWPLFFGWLLPANQIWCQEAGVLVAVCSRTTFTRNGKPNPVHSFDAGAAFENLALQAAAMGLVVHAMAGFDRERAASGLRLPTDHAVHAMLAIGRPGDPARLPPELREREAPSGRRKLDEIRGEGPFPD
jgi:nitroreductase